MKTLFAMVVSVFAAVSLPATTLQEIYGFPFNGTYVNPNGLVLGSDGAFYGTTASGGLGGYGSVFRVTANGVLTELVSFAGANGTSPQATLIQGPNGIFYGTTFFGGANGYGTVFQVTTNGTLTTLASFANTNGAYPVAPLVRATDGALYGTTSGGGSGESIYGTVFRITTNGALTTLISFADTNGSYPQARLVQASDGAFYGTTYGGGANNYGTVFRITTNGLLTTLVSFAKTNGSYPSAGLTKGADGALYGTTYSGGASNYGTIFRLTTNGAFAVLASFSGANGAYPEADLFQASDGAFYGTTYNGGSTNDYGTIFRVTTSGILTTVAVFSGNNGAHSYTGLTQASDGVLYGSSSEGGSQGGGNLFCFHLGCELLPLVRVGSAWKVSFVGQPGATYGVLRATIVTGPWLSLADVTTGSDGSGQYLDTAPPAANGFYKIVGR